MVTFAYCNILWVLKLHTYIAIYTINSEYVAFYCSIRDLLSLNGLSVLGTFTI